MITNFESKNDVLMKLISREIPYGDHLIKCNPLERDIVKDALIIYMIEYKKKFGKPLSEKLFSYPPIGNDITLHWPEHYELTADEVFKNKSTLDFMRILKLQPGESLRIVTGDVSKINVLKGMCAQKRKGEFSFKTEYPTTIVVTRLLQKKVSIRPDLDEKMLAMQDGETMFFECLEKNMPTIRTVQNTMRKNGLSFSISRYSDGGCYITKNKDIIDMDEFPTIKKVIKYFKDREFKTNENEFQIFASEISRLNNKMMSCLVRNTVEIDDEEDLL